MAAIDFKFYCPHCEQPLRCDVNLAGRDFQCPGCAQAIIIPSPSITSANPQPENAGNPTRRPRLGYTFHVLLGVLLGALAGSVISNILDNQADELYHGRLNPAIEWVHRISYRAVLSSWGILGAMVGGVWARWRFRKRFGSEAAAFQCRFSAPVSFVLAAGSWLLAILMWSWLLTRQPSDFHDQGGMAITFGLIPLTFILWLVGGPLALAFGRRGLQRSDSNLHQQLAQAGIALGRLMLFGGIIVSCLVLMRIAR